MKNVFLTLTLLLSVYNLQAQIVNIPDPNFKNALITQNVVDLGNGYWEDADTNNDNEIQVSEAEAVLWLNVEYKSISTLEGIESFSNIEVLYCQENNLTSLDFSQNLNLEFISCQYNSLTYLNITQNLNLESLWCFNNQLPNLDVSQNINLKYLQCAANQLINIDVSQLSNLIHLSCRQNQISTLDVSNNTILERLWCDENLLTSLDISQNPEIIALFCHNNNLTNLDVNNGNNHNMESLYTYNNSELTCVKVDDENASRPYCNLNPPFSGWCKDDWAVYSEECQLGITDFDIYNLKIYPNPVQNFLNIKTDLPIDNIKVYTLQGQLIDETISNNIDVSLLTTGLYFASITIDGKNIVKKFIKN